VILVRIIFGNILLGNKTLLQLSFFVLTLSLCSRVVTREIFRTIVELSILSAIPELFEKLFCDVITPIIRPSISDQQHGCSTVTSLVKFSNFVLSEMKDGLHVDAVYTDFSKAIDRVNHGLLLDTLTRKFRGPMIVWMGFYVTGRTFV
jgi:hypothetical protein